MSVAIVTDEMSDAFVSVSPVPVYGPVPTYPGPGVSDGSQLVRSWIRHPQRKIQ